LILILYEPHVGRGFVAAAGFELRFCLMLGVLEVQEKSRLPE